MKTKKEKHGMYKTSEYSSWKNMIQRCYYPNSKIYHRYGGRGITVCDRWRNSFLLFYQDMGDKPFSMVQLDRVDNDGNYEPGNCRWVSCKKNIRNSSSAKLNIKYVKAIRQYAKAGLSIKDLSLIYKVHYKTIIDITRNKTWCKELCDA